MRWSSPHHNQTRVVKRFALFPIRIHNDHIWLEMCYIRQRYSFWSGVWENEEFLTKEEAKEALKGEKNEDIEKT